MSAVVLAISTHPDDETLGCGGTLLKHRAAGAELHWLIATQPTEPAWSAEMIARKLAETETVARAYEMTSVHRLGLPPTDLESVPMRDIIGAIGTVIRKIRPNIVYLVHNGDVHSDHRLVFQAGMAACKAFYQKTLGIGRILSYETISSTESVFAHATQPFLPNVFSDITAHIERKLEIMGMYATEAQSDPLPRGPSAIRALARWRGATVGVEYAEAFMLLRAVE